MFTLVKHSVVLDTTKFHLFVVVFEHMQKSKIFEYPKNFVFRIHPNSM